MLAAFLFLLLVHWFADFVLQTDWQAQNKSKNNEALTHHVLVYTACLLAGSLMIGLPALVALTFTIFNGAFHFATDWFTSRWAAEMHRKGDRHNFFVVVGLDQLIHQLTLAATLWVLW